MPQPVTDPVYNIRTRQYEGTRDGFADTDEEAAARTQELAAVEANELTLRQRADLALDANAAFLAKPNRVQADFVAQVDALTKQQNAVIRLILRKLDSVQGTAGAGGK